MRIALILASLAVTLVAQSQEIYRWVDKNGVVHYSDQPDSPNAELINVIEPNAYEAQGQEQAGASGAGDSGEPEEDEPAVSPYGSLSIVSPTPDQVFFGADAVVNVAADLQGTLRPDHSVVFFLNGNRKQADGLSTDYSGLARGTYFLRVSIMDGAGRPGDHEPADELPRAAALDEFAAEPDRAAEAEPAEAHTEADAQALRRLTAHPCDERRGC